MKEKPMKDKCLTSLDELVRLVSKKNEEQLKSGSAKEMFSVEWMNEILDSADTLACAVSEYDALHSKEAAHEVIDSSITLATLALKMAEMVMFEKR